VQVTKCKASRTLGVYHIQRAPFSLWKLLTMTSPRMSESRWLLHLFNRAVMLLKLGVVCNATSGKRSVLAILSPVKSNPSI
jgi:hypothetical protein